MEPLTVAGLIFPTVHGVRPMFVESLKNLTVPIGRDATFTCVVRHLGGYRVSNITWHDIPVYLYEPWSV